MAVSGGDVRVPTFPETSQEDGLRCAPRSGRLDEVDQVDTANIGGEAPGEQIITFFFEINHIRSVKLI